MGSPGVETGAPGRGGGRGVKRGATGYPVAFVAACPSRRSSDARPHPAPARHRRRGHGAESPGGPRHDGRGRAGRPDLDGAGARARGAELRGADRGRRGREAGRMAVAGGFSKAGDADTGGGVLLAVGLVVAFFTWWSWWTVAGIALTA